MQRQVDIRTTQSLGNEAEIAIAWKLCDNGFPVDEGVAYFILGKASIDWRGHLPPAEDEGALRALIEERVGALRSK
jgi:hypothetical protein